MAQRERIHLRSYPTAIAGCNLWQSLLSLFPAALLRGYVRKERINERGSK